MKSKSYSELMRFNTFEERYEYLRSKAIVGEATFGGHRYLNQDFYRSKEWRSVRDKIILRDEGLDLGVEDRPIFGRVIVHHINPITIDEIANCSSSLFDPENLICVSDLTHQAIHYGDASLLPEGLVERKPNDTCPWKL